MIEAAKEDDEAMNELGSIYLFGKEGTEKNIEKAIEYYEKSVEKNNDAAMCNLANFYTEFHQPPDPEKAFELYKRAAKYENDHALFKLGLFHQLGISTQRDFEKAVECYEKSAEMGNVDGNKFLEFFFFFFFTFFFYFFFFTFFFFTFFFFSYFFKKLCLLWLFSFRLEKVSKSMLKDRYFTLRKLKNWKTMNT